MNRAKNTLQRASGRAKELTGRLTGKRRTTLRGRLTQGKADVKDDALDAKKSARKLKRS